MLQSFLSAQIQGFFKEAYMNNDKSESLALDVVCDDLFYYSIDREDMRLILNTMQDHADNNRNILEYELQALKIITVGWTISFFMFNKPEKELLLKIFWGKIQIFSAELSSTLMLTSGKNIDYFDILKRRTDMYVNSIGSGSATTDPINIIGPKFAEICNLEDSAHATLAASKLFKLTIDSVKLYLDSI